MHMAVQSQISLEVVDDITNEANEKDLAEWLYLSVDAGTMKCQLTKRDIIPH
jgi:hypothetical protein